MKKNSKKKILGFIGISGSFIVIAVFIFMMMIIGIVSSLGGDDSNQYYPDTLGLSDAVLQYSDVVQYYAAMEGIPDYTYLLLCIMQQESSGNRVDLMQASECKFNEKFRPRKPNAIKDPRYSIEVGVRNFADCLKESGGAYPFNMNTVKISLQSYNFGQGYARWVLENHGTYSYENAVEFSSAQAKKLGWSSYGDVNYVSNVLRYYNPTSDDVPGLSPEEIGDLSYPLQSISINSPWMGYPGHRGVDFKAPIGTGIYASAPGTVVESRTNGSWGKMVKISHGNNVYTLYAHCSTLLVTEGDQVQQGQLIAYSGATGNVTGPHLHFELYIGGASAKNNRVDPMPYLRGDKKLS